MLQKNILVKLYSKEGKSVQEIANIFKSSPSGIRYWMKKYGIKVRSISEAIYKKNNPNGDPFKLKYPTTVDDAKLFGLGVGLYWGEGTKADKNTVRLGNTDPDLIEKFLEFLTKIFRVSKSDMKFGLQLFTDIDEKDAILFWTKKLKIKRKQFYKVSINISTRTGTYRKKCRYGVLTVYYHNKKMRDLLVSLLPKIKNMPL
jgi:hypothetical protein